MKRITVAAFFTLATILGGGSAFAQMQPRQVRAMVPFDFTVGNKQLPAGTYSIVSTADGNVQIKNQKAQTVVLTLASQNGSPSKGCSLGFDQRGGQYFMRTIQCESAAMSLNLPASKLEERISAEVARLHANYGQILIGAE